MSGFGVLKLIVTHILFRMVLHILQDSNCLLKGGGGLQAHSRSSYHVIVISYISVPERETVPAERFPESEVERVAWQAVVCLPAQPAIKQHCTTGL